MLIIAKRFQFLDIIIKKAVRLYFKKYNCFFRAIYWRSFREQMAVVLTLHLKTNAKSLTILKHIDDSFYLLGELKVKVQWGYSHHARCWT